MTPAALIRQARARAGLSQAELAERIGSYQPSVARWESGRRSPTLATLERIAAACGLELRVRVVKRRKGDDHED